MRHPTRWIARILQENTDPRFGKCRGGRFERNLVVFRSDALRTAVNVGANTEPETFQFDGNLWICEDAPGAAKRMIRLPVKDSGGRFGTTELADWETGDVAKGKFAVPGVGARWLERW